MLFRAIALSLALLIGIGTIIPLATDSAQASQRKHRKYKRHHKRYKKYSRAWWRQYRARQRSRRAMAARRRALRLHQLRLANARKTADAGKATDAKTAKTAAEQPGVLPSGQPAPVSWKRGASSSSELQFRVDNNAGAQIGSASISVVGPAMDDASRYGRVKTVGGVPTTSLRREVIDRMIRENGWVVNDYQKEIGGRSVYVVVAQSQAGGQVNSRMFYFTEANGRIYSVATTSGASEAERLAEESEKVINSLQAIPRPTQRAALKED
ncbi:MAG TPA: hypothetical protein VL327_03740 [Pyrinomonadaceae bacterium]|jgi:hypothetical protein|nr:hypothetical protein [Pyrinomonadaceae bacterium]